MCHPHVILRRSRHSLGSLAVSVTYKVNPLVVSTCIAVWKSRETSTVRTYFQVSRTFKKAPLAHNGFRTFNSAGITADPLTRKEPRTWSLGSSQHYCPQYLRLYVHQSHPLKYDSLSIQFKNSSQPQTMRSFPTWPLFGMMLIKNSTEL